MFCNQCGKKIQPSSKFCAFCGNKIEANILDDGIQNTNAIEKQQSENIFFSFKPKVVILDEKKLRVVDTYIKKLINAKHSDEIVYEVFFTEKRVYINPIGKSGIFGVVLTAIVAPGLAQAADYLKNKAARNNAEQKIAVGDTYSDAELSIFPSMSLSSLNEVKETKKRNAAILKFCGEIQYGEEKSPGEFHIVIDGSLSDSSNQMAYGKKLLNFLNVKESEIKIF